MESESHGQQPVFLGELRRPEIEECFTQDVPLLYNHGHTSIDVLEIFRDSPDKSKWQKGLGYAELLHHFTNDEHHMQSPRAHTRVVFLKFINEKIIAASSATIDWLCKRFGVSRIFWNSVFRDRGCANAGFACFTQANDNGNPARIDSMYHLDARIDIGTCSVWFTYMPQVELATYIIVNCPVQAQNIILKYSLGPDPMIMLRLGAIDATIVNACQQSYKAHILHCYGGLSAYERSRTTGLCGEEPWIIFKQLHCLSQEFQRIHDWIEEQYDIARFIVDFQQNHILAMRGPTASAHESLEYLLVQSAFLRRKIASYIARTKIQIDLAFNVASQTDNRTNLENNRTNLQIAETTAKIARETRKDSSSMITIAALTMLFLPGTFVSVGLLSR